MGNEFVSMAVIALVSIGAPLLASLIPKKPIPEVVFLIFIGAILGPNMMGFIEINHSINLISELGLGFLFLLAGFEIDPKSLTSERGKTAFGTWFVSFALAALIVSFVPIFAGHDGRSALIIAMTATALGTLIPILKERNISDTAVGQSVIAHGTFGELLPILAMAILLSVRSTWETILILLVFAAIAIMTAVFPKLASNFGHKMAEFLSKNAETTSQTMIRATVALLVCLVTIASVFQLDIVLGAFAAGFILRFLLSDEDENYVKKLDGVAFGFFVPFFFVVSGANINLPSVMQDPALLVAFVLALLVARAIPVFISTFIPKEDRNSMSAVDRINIALYATTSLPIIVAVTNLAVSAELMSEVTSSVLVTAGAVTVLLMPVLTFLLTSIASSRPLGAAQEIANSPESAMEIFKEHFDMVRESRLEQRELERKILKNIEQAKNDSPHINVERVERLRKYMHLRDVFLANFAIARSKVIQGKPALGCSNWPELKEYGQHEWSEMLKLVEDFPDSALVKRGQTRWERIVEFGDRLYDRKQQKLK